MLFRIAGKFGGGINVLFLPIMLCCSALKFTYYAQYYAQVQELWSEYYCIYIQVCMNKLILVVDNFRKTVLLECIYKWYPNNYTTKAIRR